MRFAGWILAFTLLLICSVSVGSGAVAAQENPDPVEIEDWNDLDKVRDDPDGEYVLVADLDENTTGYETVAGPTANGGLGFAPIGTASGGFSGTFNGNNHTLADIRINRSDIDAVGLFSVVQSSRETEPAITGLTLKEVNVTGRFRTGVLAGEIEQGTVSAVSVSGNVRGHSEVGGLAGSADTSTEVTNVTVRVTVDAQESVGGLLGTADTVVKNATVRGTVRGQTDVGGLAGENQDVIRQTTATVAVTGSNSGVGGLVGTNAGTIAQSAAHGSVSGDRRAGGLVGDMHRGTTDSPGRITQSIATGNVSGDGFVGGLGGRHADGSITESYATGSATGTEDVGGLLGLSSGAVSDSYATGDVAGTERVGGFVGNLRGTVNNAYATGVVSNGGSSIGGFVGFTRDAAVIDSYWDVEATGQTASAAGTGLTTAEMTGSTARQTMTAFSFSATWSTVTTGDSLPPTPGNDGYPILSTLATRKQLARQNISPASGGAEIANGTVKRELVPNNVIADLNPQAGDADDRTRTELPWKTDLQQNRATVSIYTQYGNNTNGSSGWCSGTLVGESHVLTAAHCVYNHSTDQWARGATVRPAADNQSGAVIEPFSRAHARWVWTYEDHITATTPEENVRDDFALLALDRSIGEYTGTLPWRSYPVGHAVYSKGNSISLQGYPTTPPSDTRYPTMWFDEGSARGHSYNGVGNDATLWVDAKGSNGQSGGPYINYNDSADEFEIVGVHSVGVDSTGLDFIGSSAPASRGPRITAEKSTQLKRWMRIDSRTPPDDKPEFVFENIKFVGETQDWYEVAPTDNVGPGSTAVRINHTVRNVGTTRGVEAVTVEVYLDESRVDRCRPTTVTTAPVHTETIPAPEPFATTNITTSMTLPSDTAAGDYSVCLKIASDSATFESQPPTARISDPAYIEVGAGKQQLTDDFEDDSVESIPDGWVVNGNSDQEVVARTAASGNQSFRLSGRFGGCWEAVSKHPIEVPETGAITISASVKPTSIGSAGCHDYTNGDISLATSDASWDAGERTGLMSFDTFRNAAGRGEDLGSYNIGEWNDITITYDRVADQVTITYSINGEQRAATTREVHAFEDRLSYLQLKSGDFTVYFDNIQITSVSGTDAGNQSRTAQNGLAVNGNFAYVVSADDIHKINMTTGESVTRFNAPAGRPDGLAYGNGSLWFVDGTDTDYEGEVIGLNPDTGEVNSRIQLNYDPSGLAFGRDQLWVTDKTDHRIIGYTANGGERTDSFSIGAAGVTSPSGLAAASDGLWLGTSDGGLYEFARNGTLIQQHETRETAYGGLGTNATSLIGPAADGTVTTLRTLHNNEQGPVDVDPSNLTGNGTANDPYLVTNVSELQSINDDPAAHYELGNDIEASGTAEWNNGSGFAPIGPFTGTFDGNGHNISQLAVTRPAENQVGLFGEVAGSGTVLNVSLTEVNVTGDFVVGGLAGVNAGTIDSASVAGTISGAETVGGLVGENKDPSGSVEGTVQSSFVTGTVSLTNESGGSPPTHNGTRSDMSSLSEPLGGDVGGLVGTNTGTVMSSYSTASVTGRSNVGGLVGANVDALFGEHGTVEASFATGNVTGRFRVGGLVGRNNEGTVDVSYALGAATGDSSVGGLVGNNAEGIVNNSYAAGNVSGNTIAGGLVGENTDGTVRDSYWDTVLTGYGSSNGGTGLTMAAMTGSEARQNMVGFDFATNWTTVVAGESIPPTPDSDGHPILSGVDTQRQLEAHNNTVSAPETGESGVSPDDPTQRALQITGKNDPSALTQNDVTAVITRFNRGQSVNNVSVTQDDVTATITLFERS